MPNRRLIEERVALLALGVVMICVSVACLAFSLIALLIGHNPVAPVAVLWCAVCILCGAVIIWVGMYDGS